MVKEVPQPKVSEVFRFPKIGDIRRRTMCAPGQRTAARYGYILQNPGDEDFKALIRDRASRAEAQIKDGVYPDETDLISYVVMKAHSSGDIGRFVDAKGNYRFWEGFIKPPADRNVLDDLNEGKDFWPRPYY